MTGDLNLIKPKFTNSFNSKLKRILRFCFQLNGSSSLTHDLIFSKRMAQLAACRTGARVRLPEGTISLTQCGWERPFVQLCLHKGGH